jgi:hypothetical protein
VIRELYPAADKSVQKELAGKVLTSIKPVFAEAIETAGGTGYSKYLSDYAAGRHVVNQQEMASIASDLFKNNKKAFVELVEGNSPKDVEKVFGHGKYDLAAEMGSGMMAQLKSIADLTKRSAYAGEQASLGRLALAEIIKKNTVTFKLPWGISPGTMAMNKALDVAEHKLSRKTMAILAEGLKSGDKAADLLSFLPAKERVHALKVLSDPLTYRGVGVSMTPTIETEEGR